MYSHNSPTVSNKQTLAWKDIFRKKNLLCGIKCYTWFQRSQMRAKPHIFLKELLNQSLAESYTPVRSKLEGKKPHSAMSAAQNCPASQRALKKNTLGGISMFTWKLLYGRSWTQLHHWARIQQESAGTAMALTPTAFSYTFSVSKGRLRS